MIPNRDKAPFPEKYHQKNCDGQAYKKAEESSCEEVIAAYNRVIGERRRMCYKDLVKFYLAEMKKNPNEKMIGIKWLKFYQFD